MRLRSKAKEAVEWGACILLVGYGILWWITR